jgi:hypothetical protein
VGTRYEIYEQIRTTFDGLLSLADGMMRVFWKKYNVELDPSTQKAYEVK